jgi:hypothetical protein
MKGFLRPLRVVYDIYMVKILIPAHCKMPWSPYATKYKNLPVFSAKHPTNLIAAPCRARNEAGIRGLGSTTKSCILFW